MGTKITIYTDKNDKLTKASFVVKLLIKSMSYLDARQDMNGAEEETRTLTPRGAGT